MRLAAADGKAVASVVRLSPPSVEDGQVQPAVEDHLLAAGARGLEWTPRVVEPHVHALHQMPSDVDVVVLDKQHLARKARVPAQACDLLQDLLAGTVAGMGFAREDELDRRLRVVDQRGDRFEVLEDQVCALVGGKAPGESDRQAVQAQRTLVVRDGVGGLAATLGRAHHLPAHEIDQARLQGLMCLPQLAVIDALDVVPALRLGATVGPVGAQVAVVNLVHLRRQPGLHVHAVGDVTDRHAFLGHARVQAGPHGARDVTVQRRDRVGAARQLQRQHGHAERLAVIARVLASQRQQRVGRKAQRVAQRAEVFLDQLRREPIVAGRNGRVRCEDDLRRDAADALLGSNAFGRHAVSDQFERGKGAVAFVEMGH